jgi:hypothetical protein
MATFPRRDGEFCPTQFDVIPLMKGASGLEQFHNIPTFDCPDQACLNTIKCPIKHPGNRAQYGWFSHGCLSYLADMPMEL